jgi:hypothetical protein
LTVALLGGGFFTVPLVAAAPDVCDGRGRHLLEYFYDHRYRH